LCEERGFTPAGVTPALLDEASMLYHDKPAGLTAPEIREALDPGKFIAARTLRGGPAPAESMRQADLFLLGTVDDEKIVAAIDARLAESARKLEGAVDAILG